MPADEPISRRPVSSWRRRDIALTYANAGLWGIGNGLVGSALVIYFARSQGASGLAIGLIIASPQLVGVLRLFAPVLEDRVGNRRLFCVQTFLLSAVLLACLPFTYWFAPTPTSNAPLAAVVVLWSLYHLAEFLGVVSLWSWIADLVSPPVRGRYIGRRGAWMNAGRVTGTLLGIAATTNPGLFLTTTPPAQLRNASYALCMAVGAALLAAAVIPLACMRETRPPGPSERSAATRVAEALAPFRDQRFRRFLAYGTWFSFSNGITASAQYYYMISYVQLPYWMQRSIDTSTRAAQSLVMPSIGRRIDARGAVPTMVVCQVLVALGLACFLRASAGQWWWIALAYVLWIAYAGLNVGMPHLMLKLAQPDHSASYVAAWFAWTKLVYGLTSILGGQLLDRLSLSGNTKGRPFDVDYLAFLVACGVALRLITAFVLARIRED